MVWIGSQHRFDADPDPDPNFHFDTDSGPDPDPGPSPSLYVHIGKSENFELLFTEGPISLCTLFYFSQQRHSYHIF